MPVEVLPGQRVSLKDLIEESKSGSTKLLNVHWDEFHAGVERFLKAVSFTPHALGLTTGGRICAQGEKGDWRPGAGLRRERAGSECAKGRDGAPDYARAAARGGHATE